MLAVLAILIAQFDYRKKNSALVVRNKYDLLSTLTCTMDINQFL